MAEAATPSLFAVRLTLPDGSTRKVQCDGQTTVLQILQAVAAKLDGSQDAHARFQLLAPGAGAAPLPTDAISGMAYVRECQQQRKRPAFTISKRRGPVAARKRWAFRILFELPSGQVTEISCAGSLAVAQVKADVQEQWAAAQPAAPGAAGSSVLRVLDIDACRSRGYAGPDNLEESGDLQSTEYLAFCLQAGLQPKLRLEVAPAANRGAGAGAAAALHEVQVRHQQLQQPPAAAPALPVQQRASASSAAARPGAADVLPHHGGAFPAVDRREPEPEPALPPALPQQHLPPPPQHEAEAMTEPEPKLEPEPEPEQPASYFARKKPPPPKAQPLPSDEEQDGRDELVQTTNRSDPSTWLDGDVFFSRKKVPRPATQRVPAAAAPAFAPALAPSEPEPEPEPEPKPAPAPSPTLRGPSGAPLATPDKAAASSTTATAPYAREARSTSSLTTPRSVAKLDGQGHLRKAAAAHGRERRDKYHNRTAFTWEQKEVQLRDGMSTVPLAQRKMAEIAHLVGFENSLDDDFFQRRSRFRRTMQTHVASALREPHQNKTDDLDIPGYWTRPTLMPAKGLPSGFQITCLFPPLETPVELSCRGAERMTELLEKIYGKYPPNHPRSKPDHPLGLILKARGLYDFLDGDECLHDYRHVRAKLGKQEPIEVTVLHRAEIVADINVKEAEVLDEDGLQEEAGTDDENVDYEELEKHFDLGADKGEWEFIPITEVRRPFRLRVIGIDQLPEKDIQEKTHVDGKEIVEEPTLQIKSEGKGIDEAIWVEAALCYGGELLADRKGVPLEPQETQRQRRNHSPRWNEWLNFDFDVCRLPQATRLCMTVRNKQTLKGETETRPLGWVNLQLFDDANRLRTGVIRLRLWPKEEADPIGTCVENIAAEQQHLDKTGERNPAIIYIELDEYHKMVLFPSQPTTPLGLAHHRAGFEVPKEWTQADKKELNRVVRQGPLYELTAEDKKLIINLRFQCKSKPRALAKFLQAIDWGDPNAVQEGHSLLDDWDQLSTTEALELLDARYADQRIRTYAVKCLHAMTDEELELYMLQLIQVLKYEQFHDSALACFLMFRALQCPNVIGHLFFWYLKSNMHDVEIAERYGLLLEMYLGACGCHRRELLKQNDVMEKLISVAAAVKDTSKSRRPEVIREQLRAIELPSEFTLPLNPRWKCKGLVVDGCRSMSSKKVPLWLEFENGEAGCPNFLALFKEGDDLRQDLLTLQLLRIMDNIWKKEGKDLKLIPYGCVSTGNELGFIEVVTKSNTCAGITNEIGGGALGVFDKEVIERWLREKNPDQEAHDRAVKTFVDSCAGYCVATYILGIGDRHNDNVMISENGNFFHIDFGHFLGNIKKKLGIKREKAPFIFTPQMERVMKGESKESEEYTSFEEQCQWAFNVIRKHSSHLINLFQLMLSTGIPELQKKEDINYLRDSLYVKAQETDTEAARRFQSLIRTAVKTKTTQYNDMAHIIAHR